MIKLDDKQLKDLIKTAYRDGYTDGCLAALERNSGEDLSWQDGWERSLIKQFYGPLLEES